VQLFDFAAEHRSMYHNIVPSAVTQRVVTAFRTELQPACEEIAKHGMPLVSPIAELTPESVSRFLVGGFMEVLWSWMEDPDSTGLCGRVSAALDTVNALLGQGSGVSLLRSVSYFGGHGAQTPLVTLAIWDAAGCVLAIVATASRVNYRAVYERFAGRNGAAVLRPGVLSPAD
jgi:hypothetical protein